MFYESVFRRVTSFAIPLLCIPALSGIAVASSIGFPVGIGNFTPDSYVGEIYGTQYTADTGSLADGSAVGLNAGNTSIPYGTTAELNMCGVPVCEGGNEIFGGFADVPTGTLGAFAASTISEQATANARLLVNLAFAGTGTVTLKMHVEGIISGQDDMYDGSEYAGEMMVQGYSLNSQTGIATPQGNSIEVGASICEGAGFKGCSQPGDSLSQDVSIVLNVDPQHDLFSFFAQALAYTAGEASADGAHTSAMSVALSPGVTLDQSNGFLTEPGEPNFGSAPEPSTLALSGLALAGLGFVRRRLNRSAAVPK